jgi:3-oxoacyl-[acyl-carrier-protein] synthase II
MNHSCAANIAQSLGIGGRILAPSAACSTGCQAIGYGFEMIAFGKQDFALCGGADEFHPLFSATFDMVNAASFNFNDKPKETPRPFDRDRDGIVCAEGSGILILESLESALGREATILAEIIGFATVASPDNIARPDEHTMVKCMIVALKDAGIEPGEVDYINAHATATEQGDIAESRAINKVFGEKVPVSSLKGHLGHTMAASGSIEVAATIEMMKGGYLVPTLNLDNIDELCKNIRHIQEVEKSRVKTVIKNSFAFGGVNSTIVLRRYKND